MVQKLEGVLSKSLREVKNLYYHKLHNNPLAHQKTPADFIVHNKKGTTIYIECKECKLKDGKGSFAFSRLTQEQDLEIIENFSNSTISAVMILFRDKTLKKSSCFIIQYKTYKMFKKLIPKKSANIKDFKDYLSYAELDVLPGSIFDMNFLNLW